MTITRDISYRTEGGPQHRLDLYEPDAPRPGRVPGIVIIHGGGWRILDKAEKRETQMAETLAAAGYVCASINYTMIPHQSPAWPAYLHDARAATRWLRQQPGVDPQRVGAIGGSAGGNMSLLLGVAADGFEPVRAVVALYPPTDMAWAGRNRTALLGHSVADRPDIARDASPLHLATEQFPPTFLIHGTNDATVPHDHSERMAARLNELGVPHQLRLVEGGVHSFRLADENRDLRDDVIGFFNTHLRPD